ARRADRRRQSDARARDRRAAARTCRRRHHHPPDRAPDGCDRAAVRPRDRARRRPHLDRGHVRNARRESCRAGSVHGPAPMGFLNVSGVVAGYTAADEILKGLDFSLDAGEIVCVIGPNGAGKSTLLKAIAGLLTPSRGAITFKNRSLVGVPPRDITLRGVAYVPEEHTVFPSMSVAENLEIGGYVAPARVPERMVQVLARFPVLANKRRHAARTLSGGERQILAMAMALMVEPELLLLDEPSAGL